MIVKFGPVLDHKIYVPDYALNDDGVTSFKYDSIELSSLIESVPFELDTDKWFVYYDGQIVRFPKDKEWDWRCKKAEEIVSLVSKNPLVFKGPEDRLAALENAAYLSGFNLADLVDKLNKARQDNESISDVFKRILKERKS